MPQSARLLHPDIPAAAMTKTEAILLAWMIISLLVIIILLR
jgi:hypothetical protein